ncbi:MAG: hypothetical protein ACXW4N_03230 [Candidatus Deferrimicrobiaceae bacterium]
MANFFSCSIVASESVISPLIGRTATFSPRTKENPCIFDTTARSPKTAPRTRTMIRHPRRSGRRGRDGV